MDSENPVEVSVSGSIYSIANGRHACGGKSRPERSSEKNFCGFCGALLDKKVEIRMFIRMPNADDMKPFLVELCKKIRKLAEDETIDFLAEIRG